MRTNWLIVDGNNFIHFHPDLAGAARRDFDGARSRLVALLDEMAGELAPRTTIVFDGRAGAGGPAYEGASVEVLFAPAHLSADTVIERLVRGLRDPSSATVVTSDRGERDTVEASGGHTLSCRGFLEETAAAAARLRARARTLARGGHRRRWATGWTVQPAAEPRGGGVRPSLRSTACRSSHASRLLAGLRRR